MNQLQRLKTLFLVLIITAPAISRANAETPERDGTCDAGSFHDRV